MKRIFSVIIVVLLALGMVGMFFPAISAFTKEICYLGNEAIHAVKEVEAEDNEKNQNRRKERGNDRTSSSERDCVVYCRY